MKSGIDRKAGQTSDINEHAREYKDAMGPVIENQESDR